MRRTGFLAATILVLSLAASAQESEFSLQGTGFFTKSVNGTGTTYSATQAGGALATYRHHLSNRLKVEAAYGYARNTQKYMVDSQPFRIETSIHQVTGSFVMNLVSGAHSKLNPYLLLGGGALIFEPIGNQFNTLSGARTQTKGGFMYGAGVNYAIRKKLALRAEYRGLIYGTPDFGFGALITNAVTHTAIPTVGVVFKF